MDYAQQIKQDQARAERKRKQAEIEASLTVALMRSRGYGLVRGNFAPTASFEKALERELKFINNRIKEIINSKEIKDKLDLQQLIYKLHKYHLKLKEWDSKQIDDMLNKLNQINKNQWVDHLKNDDKKYKNIVLTIPIIMLLLRLKNSTKEYLTKLPLDAINKIENYSEKGIISGLSFSDIVKKIKKIPSMNYRHLKLIARTQAAFTMSILTEKRARALGCENFIWQTMEDDRVRESHAAMQGQICSFDNPPIVDGFPLLPGRTYNCRCYMVPIIKKK